MPFWSSPRRLRPELMDDPALPREQHERALAGLGRINWLSRSDAILWPAVARHARAVAPRALRVVDVASGGGDILFALERRARRAGLAIEGVGVDASPVAVEYATAAARRTGSAVQFQTADALAGPPLPGADVVCSSLFLHHLTEDAGRALLQRMGEAATRCALVNDLSRGWLGYLTAWIVTRVVTRSPVVHYDGPVSVAGAFTPAEALALARSAGWTEATVVRRWPFRFLLSWERS
jgi:SAM-dependent methyltransferase